MTALLAALVVAFPLIAEDFIRHTTSRFDVTALVPGSFAVAPGDDPAHLRFTGPGGGSVSIWGRPT